MAYTSTNRFEALASKASSSSASTRPKTPSKQPNGHADGSEKNKSLTTSSGESSRADLANGHAVGGSTSSTKSKSKSSKGALKASASANAIDNVNDLKTANDGGTANGRSPGSGSHSTSKPKSSDMPALNGFGFANGHAHAKHAIEDGVDALRNRRQKGSENVAGKHGVTTRKEKKVKKEGKVDWEVPRKTLHSSIGFVVLYLYSLQPETLRPLLTVLITGLVSVFSIDLVRLRHPSFASTYEQVLGWLMRESEKTKINGVIWYLVGVIFVLGFYPRDVAVISILTLSWSDTAASTIGRLLGPRSPRLPSHVPGIPFLPFAKRKSLAGFIAAAVTGFSIAMAFWWNGTHTQGGDDGHWEFLNLGHTNAGLLSPWLGGAAFLGKPLGLWLTSLILGFGGAVVEAIDVGLDDNMTLPIGTGALIWAWFLAAGKLL